MHASENEFGDRLRVAGQRERELTDKLHALGRQMAELAKEADAKQQKLVDTEDELALLNRWTSSRGSDTVDTNHAAASGPHQRLQDDVESLRYVLELKQQEIGELRKQNVQLVREADALPAATLRVHTLESRLEDLQLQLEQKSVEDK